MATLVKDEGRPDARLILIGEAPGANEAATGRPFVGAAGFKVSEWWRACGLNRTDFYITNVYPYRPPGNDINTVPKGELETWVDALHDRLATLTDPWVIVPTGNTALQALTGKRGITKHRGSLYTYQDRRGRSIKVIPTIHPAAVFRTPLWERRCRLDWQRVSGDASFRELRTPVREHFTRPTLNDVEAYVVEAARADVLALDIETPGGEITCVGFATDPSFSITVPTTRAYWGTDASVDAVWGLIKDLCESPVAKATQNGHFDAFWLAGRGIGLANWQWDTLALHHAIDATEDHALAYMASIDTREPYWKDEAKDPEEAAKYASNLEAFWVYNGKDVTVTHELAGLYAARLAGDGRLGFYQRHYRDLFGPVLGMMRTGITMDDQARRRRYAGLFHKCVTIQECLTSLCGRPLHATTRNKKREEAGKLPDLSAKKVATFLYEDLKLPPIRDRQTRSVTAKEVAIRQLMLKHSAKPLPPNADGLAQLGELVGVPLNFGYLGGLVLGHRRTRKLMEFLDEGLLDDDSHMRYTFKFTTDTGRFACGKSPTMRRGQRTGRNVQNIDRELRGVFLPEAGCVFVECDLSQAEDRIVKMLAAAVTGNIRLRERARAQPWENDEHRQAASIIFKKPLQAVTKDERYIGKRARHATNYDLHGRTFSEALLIEGIIYTPDECQAMIDAIHHADPDIKAWHTEVRRQVMTHRCLVNSWGRMLAFDYERLDDDTYRRAYAFVPQSEVPGIINQYGLVPLSAEITRRRWQTVIHLQGHDSLLMSCPPGEVWDVLSFLSQSMSRPRRIGGEPLTVPVVFKIGRTWGDMTEFKRPPTKVDVEAAIEGV